MEAETCLVTVFQNFPTEEKLWRARKHANKTKCASLPRNSLNLWTTPFSDCICINGWNAPTIYDILEFVSWQDTKDVSKEAVIEYIKKHFELETSWERLMNKYWDKVKGFL